MALASTTKSTSSTAKTKAAVKAKVPTTNTYVYKGVDKRGNKMQGEISGGSPTIVKALLAKQGITTKSVAKKGKPLFGSSGKAIKPADIAVYFFQCLINRYCTNRHRAVAQDPIPRLVNAPASG